MVRGTDVERKRVSGNVLIKMMMMMMMMMMVMMMMMMMMSW